MSWEERLKKPEITTPDNKIYTFLYEDVSKSFVNKTSRYTFSGKDGAFVRNFGVGAIDIPMRMIFSGPNYDRVAKAFDKSAALPGSCTLNHPIYGIKTVVIESIAREDNLKTAANEAIFDVQMVETIVQDIPLSGAETFSGIFNDIISFVEDAGTIIEEAIYDVTNNNIFNLAKSRWNTVINTYSKTFDKIINATESLRETFDTTVSGIKGNIDTLLTKPQELGSAITNVFRIPAGSPVLAQTKNEAYYELIDDLQIPILDTGVDAKNQRLELQINLTGLLVGVCESNLLASEDGQSFVTRADAIDAAVQLIDTYNEVQEFLDNEQVVSETESLEERFVVSDLNTQNLIDIIKTTAGNLIMLSFSLQQERIIELQEDRNFIELCHELYGTTEDDFLEFFIKTNKFVNEEFIMIPKGREIKYYI